MAGQLQHSSLQISYTILDMVARQRCAKRALPENEQVHRTVRLNETNTQNERLAGTVACEATGEARNEKLRGAQGLQQGLVKQCSVRPA